MSWYTPISEDIDEDLTIGDTIADTRENPEEILIKKDFNNFNNRILYKSLKCLEKNELDLIKNRYLKIGKKITLKELAIDCGNISSEAIRLKEKKILKKLKKIIFLKNNSIKIAA